MHLHMDAVQVQDGIDRLKRPGLPSLDLINYCIVHRRNQVGRYLGAVHLLHMALNFTNLHATGIQRDDQRFATRGMLEEHFKRQGVQPLVRIEMESVHSLIKACRMRSAARLLGSRLCSYAARDRYVPDSVRADDRTYG